MTHKKDSADKLNYMCLIVQFANNDKRGIDRNSQRLFLVMELRGVEHAESKNRSASKIALRLGSYLKRYLQYFLFFYPSY